VLPIERQKDIVAAQQQESDAGGEHRPGREKQEIVEWLKILPP